MEVVCAVYEPPLKSRIWLPTAALLTHQQHLWQVARCIAPYSRLPGSLLSLQDKLFKHLKIRKWEINCIPDRWRRNFAQYCDGWDTNGTFFEQLNATWEGGGTWFESCVFPVSLWLQGRLQGCLWRHKLCVSWYRGRLGSEVHLRFIYSAVWRRRKNAGNRDENSMKGWLHRFPLPAESFRELTVKLQMLSKRPAVIFLPLNHKTLEERLNRLRQALWTWILELSEDFVLSVSSF